MADQELKARLIVEKDGEPEAFSEAAEGVSELAEAAEEAVPALESLSDAQQKVDAGSKDSTKIFEILKGSFSGWLQTVKGGLQLFSQTWASFRQGYAAGSKLRDIFNELSNGGFDRTIRGWSTSFLEFVGIAREVDDSAENLALAMATLKAKGIDPAKLSNEEILKTYRELGQQLQDHRNEQAKLTKAYEDFIEKTGLSKKGLEEQAESLAGVIASFAAANAQLSANDLTKIFGQNVQALLDQFRLLGVEVPPELAKVAAAWGVVTSVAEQEAAKHAVLIAKLRTDILGSATEVVTDVRTLIAALPEALAGLDLKDLDLLDPAAADRAREVLQRVVDAAQAAGVQLPAHIAEMAASVGILVPAMATAAEAYSSFTASTAQADNATAAVTTRVDEFGNVILVQADRASQAADSFGKMGDQARQGGEGAAEGAQHLQTYGEAAVAAALATQQGAQDLDAAATQYEESARKVQGSTAALEGQAKAAGDAGASLGETAKGAQDVAAASDAATAAAGTMEGQLGSLRTEVDQLRADFSTLPALLRAAFEGASSATLRSEIQLAIADARALRQELEAVQNVGAG